MSFKLSFVKNFFLQSSTVFLGSASGNFLLIISLPLITSLYSTSSFGFHAIFYSTLATLSALITSRFDMAMVISKKEEVFPLFILSIMSIFFYIFIISICLTYINISEIFDEDMLNNLNDLKIIIFFGIFLIGLLIVLESFTNREQNYRLLSISRFLMPVSFLLISFFPLEGDFTTKNLIIAQSFSPLSSIIIICFWMKNKAQISTSNIFFKIKYTFNKYKNYATVSAPTSFLNNLAASSPIFLIGFLYSEELVALYALALRLGYGPLSMISRSVSQVTLRTVSGLYKENKNLYKPLKKLMFPFIFLLIPMFLIIFISEDIIRLFFDDEWLATGKILQILIPIFFFKFFVSCFSTSLEAMNRVIVASLWKLFAIIVIPIGIYISSIFFNEIELFILLSIIEFLLYFIYLYLILYYAYKTNSKGID